MTRTRRTLPLLLLLLTPSLASSGALSVILVATDRRARAQESLVGSKDERTLVQAVHDHHASTLSPAVSGSGETTY